MAPSLPAKNWRMAREWTRAAVGNQGRRHIIFWILPTAVSSALVLAYFSGNPLLRNFVASPANREFGLLEHLQSLIICMAFIGGVLGYRRADSWVEKTACALFAGGSALMLLEEIDYGLHYWEWAFGDSGLVTLSIHNMDDNSALPEIKKASNLILVLLFVVVPLAAGRFADRRVVYFVPDRMLITTVVAAFAVSQLAHVLDKAGWYPDGPLTLNVSEFRETFTYYAFMLYGLDLALHRRWPSEHT